MSPAKKKKTRRKAPRKRGARLTPRRDKQGLDAAEVLLGLDAPDVSGLVDEVRAGDICAFVSMKETETGDSLSDLLGQRADTLINDGGVDVTLFEITSRVLEISLRDRPHNGPGRIRHEQAERRY